MIATRKVRTFSNYNEGLRYFRYNKSSILLNTKFSDHPLILSGYLKPSDMLKYGITTNENYYIVNKVTHNYQDKYDMHLAEVNPSFQLKEDFNSYQLSTGFHLIPESVLKSDLKKHIIFLRDKGVDLGQEQQCLNSIIERSINFDKVPMSIYDSITETWIVYNVPFSELNLYKSLDEKKKAFEYITGNYYNDSGEFIVTREERLVAATLVILLYQYSLYNTVKLVKNENGLAIPAETNTNDNNLDNKLNNSQNDKSSNF